MTIYVAKYLGYNVTVQGGDWSLNHMPNGSTRLFPSPDAPHINVQFKPGKLTQATRLMAYNHFINREGKAAFGALPYEEDGTSSDPDIGMYRGEKPDLRLSLLDTSDPTQVRPDQRALVEQALDNFHERNIEYIRIEEEKAPKPWATYDEEMKTGQGVQRQRVIDDGLTMIRRLRLDPLLVAEYEMESGNKQDWLAEAFRAEATAQEQARAEAGVLSGTL